MRRAATNKGPTLLLDDYFSLREKVFQYFGYVEDWRVLPINDCREYFWALSGTGPGVVGYAATEEALQSQDGEYYEDDIYTQRHLPKWVYRGKDHTMICVDTHTDGNQLLSIFDNAKERSRDQ